MMLFFMKVVAGCRSLVIGTVLRTVAFNARAFKSRSSYYFQRYILRLSKNANNAFSSSSVRGSTLQA